MAPASAGSEGPQPVREEEDQPHLPLHAMHWLLPRILQAFGSGSPKAYWLKHLAPDFLGWVRAMAPEYRGYRNAWPIGQMRRYCEECPDVEVPAWRLLSRGRRRRPLAEREGPSWWP